METVIYTIVSIALEQFVASPIIYGLWDIPLLSFLHGTPLAKIPAVVRQKLLPLLIANAKLWTVVNVLIVQCPTQVSRRGLELCRPSVANHIVVQISIAQSSS
jgi:hypothetical protein